MIYAKELDEAAQKSGGMAKRGDDIEQICRPLILNEIKNLKQQLMKRFDPSTV